MQNVVRGPEGKGAPGLACATCHAAVNTPASYGANMPPGAPNWHLPPPEQKMVFIDLSAGELCRVVRDPKKNGGKDFAALFEHVAHDKLVLWGWDPGVGRAPVAGAARRVRREVQDLDRRGRALPDALTTSPIGTGPGFPAAEELWKRR